MIDFADLKFVRRLGPDPHANGAKTVALQNCPDILQLESGGFRRDRHRHYRPVSRPFAAHRRVWPRRTSGMDSAQDAGSRKRRHSGPVGKASRWFFRLSDTASAAFLFGLVPILRLP